MRISDWSSDVCSSDLDKSFEPGGSHFIAFTSDPSSIPFTTSHVENKNKALYGQIGYKITDQMTLNLGGRYSWDNVSACGGSSLGNHPTPQNAYFTRAACEDQAALGLADGVGIINSKGEEPSWRSEEQTSELQSLKRNSYTGYCLNTKS